MLSRLAKEFADEIQAHDWSDAPWRIDRAGHQREHDSKKGPEQLDERETGLLRTNVMWVVAQVLLHDDPNLNVIEFAEACGVPRRIVRNTDGRPSGAIMNGLRTNGLGQVAKPGTWVYE